MKIYTNPSGSEYIEFAAPRTGSTMTSEIATREIDGIFSSFYQVIQNPDPVLKKTGNYIDILDEIKREPRVSSCRRSRKSGVLRRKWKLEPKKASSKSIDTIQKLFDDLDMRQIIREILDAWGYGYQVSEVVWKRTGNLMLPVKMVGKPNKWFMFGRENELRIKRTAGDFNGTPVEERKFLLTQYESDYSNPYGEAQYSLCFWPVTFKKGGLKFWSVFLEKFGMPHAVAKMSRGANPNERRDCLNALRQMVRDACAVFPDDATVELLTSAVSGSADAYEGFARYHDSQISTVILGHSGAIDSTPGRLGGDDTAMEVRGDIIDDDCAMVQNTINTLIKWIHELNPSLGVEKPAFELYEPTSVNKSRAERDTALMNTGKITLTKNYFTRKYDFDDDEIEVVDERPVSAAQPEFSAPEKPSSSDDSQSIIDELADELDSKTQSQIETFLKPVFDAINNADSYDAIKTKLAEIYPLLNENDLLNVLEKAMFLSETLGRATQLTTNTDAL